MEVFICAGQSEIAACLKVCYALRFFLPLCVRASVCALRPCVSVSILYFFLAHACTPCSALHGWVCDALLKISAFLRSKAAAATFLITHTAHFLFFSAIQLLLQDFGSRLVVAQSSFNWNYYTWHFRMYV